MKHLIFFTGFFVLCGCREIPFTEEDIPAKSKESKEEVNALDNLQTKNAPPRLESNTDIPIITKDTEKKEEPQAAEETPTEEPPFPEEEITLISENLELTEDKVIKNRKVVLDMVTVKTFEHDLFIIAEEFVSNHSIIGNFPKGQRANEKKDGRNGGHVLIKAGIAKGSLGLILNGENGGMVPKERHISSKERDTLAGQNGINGFDAVYKNGCLPMIHQFSNQWIMSSDINQGTQWVMSLDINQGTQWVISPDINQGTQWVMNSNPKKTFSCPDAHLDTRWIMSIQPNTFRMDDKKCRGTCVDFCDMLYSIDNKECRDTCIHPPTPGRGSGDGQNGYPGFDGKKGGDSGSFYLQAASLSDFYLTDVQKTAGLGSRGGKGSAGGDAGEPGRNGRDPQKLCGPRYHFHPLRQGKKGNRGKRGKNGENGKTGRVCLEKLKIENSPAQEDIGKELLEIHNNQLELKENKTEKVEIVCEESETNVACREVLVETQLVGVFGKKKQQENMMCY